MAVKYLSGNRLWGTDAERLGLVSGSIKLDTKDSKTEQNSNETSEITSFTVADNDDRMLIVQASAYNPDGPAPSATFGSDPFVEISSIANSAGGNGISTLLYLADPTAESATIEVDWGEEMDKRGIGVYSFYNVKQSGSGADAIGTPVTATSGASQQSTIQTSTADGSDVVAVTPATAGSALIDGISWILGSGKVPVQTLTLGWINVYPSGKTGASQYNLSPTISSSNVMNWTAEPSASVAHWAWHGFELKCETDLATTVKPCSANITAKPPLRKCFADEY